MKNQGRVLWIHLLLLIAIVLSTCKEAPPTEEEWTFAKSALLERVKTVTFRNLEVEYDTTRIDFFVTNGKWFVALIVSYGDSAGAYQPYIGRLSGHHIYNQFMSPINKLDKKELLEYKIRLETGSIYSLVGQRNFWKSEKNLQKIWGCACSHTINGAFTETGAGFMSISIKELREK